MKLTFQYLALTFVFAAAAIATADERGEVHRVTQAKFESVDGKSFEVPATGSKATVLIFLSSTCPIANGYAPEIERLRKDYASKGVDIRLVHTETDLTDEEAAEHLREYKYKCPVLLDPERTLVKQTGATITPEAALLSADGELLYRGRIDDRFPDIGIQRDRPTKQELRDAIDATLAGNSISIPRTKAVGCFIE